MSIYKTSQDTYDFSDVKDHSHVGIRISGGADSAAVAIMLWKTISDNKLTFGIEGGTQTVNYITAEL